MTLCLEPDEHRERCIFVANHAGPCSHETAAAIRANLNAMSAALRAEAVERGSAATLAILDR